MQHTKTVMITGASRGIGRAIAEAFAKDGWQLALCCHSRMDKLEELKAGLSGISPEIMISQTDVSDYDQVKAFTDAAIARFGHIDVLINNAGISYIGLLTDMSPQQWHSVIDTNLTGVFHFCHEIVPGMVHEKSGRIINISSVWGCSGASCEAAYSASKGGVNMLTQALARELAPSGIAVNAIACGTIDTEMNHCFSEEERQALTEEIPAGRFGEPSEVAKMALMLANAPVYMTGQIIKLDGGWI